jgi:DNA-binding beta-propeller fold protein YncE
MLSILITDTHNHRIIRVSYDSKGIVWQHGCATVNNLGRCSTEAFLRPTAATPAGKNILVTDRENHRIVEISEDSDVIDTISTTSDRNLWYPNYAERLADGNTLIADGFNNRVIEVDSSGDIVWQYGCARQTAAAKCAYGTGPNELRNPGMVERLADGNTLITDSENSRIIEVDQDGNLVWEFKSKLNIPYSAHKLDNGNVLISNTRSNSVMEVDQDGNLVWQFKTGISIPTDARRLGSGNTLITDSFNNRIIEVDPDGNIIWQYGSGSFGAAEGQLGKPSSALLI